VLTGTLHWYINSVAVHGKFLSQKGEQDDVKMDATELGEARGSVVG
jgi:hypothetical protein